MSSSLVKSGQKGLLASKSTSGAVGKGMVVAGTGALALSLAAWFIPFVGVFGLGVGLVILGLLLAE